MKIAQLPENETSRLASLYDYDILDSEREGIFDELTELAASIFDAPIALMPVLPSVLPYPATKAMDSITCALPAHRAWLLG